MQNVLVFRFANTLFEPVWNFNFIDHVQITVSETVKMEGAATTTTSPAVLRDIVPKPLLQLLTMRRWRRPPASPADSCATKGQGARTPCRS